jgi:hypothetical protein
MERKQRKERNKETKFKETKKYRHREKERERKRKFSTDQWRFPWSLILGQTSSQKKKRFCFLWRKISPVRNKLLLLFSFLFF